MTADVLDARSEGLLCALGIDAERDLTVSDAMWERAIDAMLRANEAAVGGPRRKS